MSHAQNVTPRLGDSIGRSELLRVLNRGQGASLVDEVILAVGSDIIEGRLRPGDDLNSVDLARTFRSSRTPIREALLTLEREGFVEISAHRRPRVAPLQMEEVRELYHLRAELCAMVSHSVVRVRNDDDLARLGQLQDDLVRAEHENDLDRYFWINVQFRNTEARDLRQQDSPSSTRRSGITDVAAASRQPVHARSAEAIRRGPRPIDACL